MFVVAKYIIFSAAIFIAILSIYFTATPNDIGGAINVTWTTVQTIGLILAGIFTYKKFIVGYRSDAVESLRNAIYEFDKIHDASVMYGNAEWAHLFQAILKNSHDDVLKNIRNVRIAANIKQEVMDMISLSYDITYHIHNSKIYVHSTPTNPS